ncbi:MAG: peptide chain release factor 1 [Oscillospiraceae bacterium]|nr:peptide chain release factor 1 [Oscillospiraceae bacterium]
MLSELKKAEKRLEEINDQVCKINPKKDYILHKSLMKEFKKISPIVNKYKKIKKIELNIKSFEELLSEAGSDLETKKMIEEEINSSKLEIKKILEELKSLILSVDQNDNKNVIIEIRGGAGGNEAALFAERLLRMYSMYSQKYNWKIEILNSNEIELGGFKEISFIVIGENAYSKFKFESGVHRVQRVPETESQGRVHTSTVTVAVLPEAKSTEIEINPKDLQIDTFRASGAGGQHINKTESAIRITYLPTGLVVECQDERSQHKNKDKAMKVLRSRLMQSQIEEQNAKTSEQRRIQVGTGDRSERIRTYNFSQNRVTDHRIGLTIYKLEEIMNGNLDEIIDALTIFEKTKLLANANLNCPSDI